MPVDTIKARLAEIQHDVLDVLAYAQGPLALSTMPVLVNFTGAAQYDYTTADVVEITRRYVMRLYIREVGQGIDGEAERLAEPWFAKVYDCFSARRRLNGLAYVRNSRLVSDSGLSVSQYAGQSYLAIDFTIEVLDWSEITYVE